MSVEITLTRDEIVFAAQGGLMRNIENLLKGGKPRFGHPYEQLWARHINGAHAELAVAKYLGVYWTPVYEKWANGLPDLPGGREVRSITRPGKPLAFYEGNKPERKYLLVHVETPKLTLIGWLFGHEIMRDEWLAGTDDKGKRRWEAPQSALRPINPTEQAAAA